MAPALARLAARLPGLRAARPCVLGLPLSALSVRRLHLPFADAAKRAQAFPFALEESMLAPAEQTAGAFAVLGADERGADLLAYAARRDDLRRLFADAPDDAPDPDIACPTLHALALAAAAGTDADFLLLHGDAGAADIALVRADGAIHACRHLILDGPEGGDDTARLAAHIRQSLTLFRREGAAAEPARVALCGQIAQSPDLAETLAAALGLPCGRPPFPRAVRNLSPEYDAAYACARLALEGADAAPNFRAGEFAPKKRVWQGRGARRWVAPAIAAALACLALLWFQSHRLAAESARLREEMARVYRSAHPEVTVTREPYMEMRAARQARGGAALPPLFDPNRPGALALLADISGRIPQDLPLTAQRLTLEPGGASLRGETASFGEVDRIRALLAASPHFSGARILSSTAEQSGGRERVRFELRLESEAGGEP